MYTRSFYNKLRSLEDSCSLSSSETTIDDYSDKLKILQRLILEIDGNRYVESLVAELLSIALNELQGYEYYEFLHYGCLSIAYKYVLTRDIFYENLTTLDHLKQYMRGINHAEVQIARIVRFDISLPTNAQFFKIYLKMLNITFNEFTVFQVYYLFKQIEISQCRYLPSIVAICVLYYSYSKFLNESRFTITAFSNLSGYQEAEIVHCLRYLSKLIDVDMDLLPTYYVENPKDVEKVLLRKTRSRGNDIIDINNVDIGEKLGSGGFSTVHKVMYQDFNYAIKIFNCEKSPTLDTYPEITFLKYLSHATILSSVGIVQETEKCFTVMTELLETDLYHLLMEGIEYDFKIRIIRQILEAVRYMHSVGLVHGDLKPENVLIRSRDIKVADFGGSKIVLYTEENNYHTSHGMTPLYQPIENLMGIANYSYSLDMWACGMIILEIIAGHNIVEGKIDVSVRDLTPDLITRAVLETFGTGDIDKLRYTPGYSDYMNLDFPGDDLNSTVFYRYDNTETMQELINNLLDYERNRRMSAQQAIIGHYV